MLQKVLIVSALAVIASAKLAELSFKLKDKEAVPNHKFKYDLKSKHSNKVSENDINYHHNPYAAYLEKLEHEKHQHHVPKKHHHTFDPFGHDLDLNFGHHGIRLSTDHDTSDDDDDDDEKHLTHHHLGHPTHHWHITHHRKPTPHRPHVIHHHFFHRTH